ncbi:MAG: hypothetical protein R3Y53_09140 [Bacillota bacterium]
MKKEENKTIPMQERWEKEPIVGEVCGYKEVSIKDQIKANRFLFDQMIKQGMITKEEAEKEHMFFVEKLYETLEVLV